jgi:hypothetical protein
MMENDKLTSSDIDGDGHEELVASVSYFYDK